MGTFQETINIFGGLMDYFAPFRGDSLTVMIWNDMSFGILIYSEMRNFFLKLFSFDLINNKKIFQIRLN